jgi:segregation and condensation protein B
MNTAQAKRVLETALICSQQPLQVRDMRALFDDGVGAETIKRLLHDIQLDWTQHGVELRQVASSWTGSTRRNRLGTPAPRSRRWQSSLTVSR